MEKKYEFKYKYLEDIDVEITYTSRSCMCSMDCNEDSLEFNIDGEYYGSIELVGSQKGVMLSLLQGEDIIKVTNDKVGL